MTNGSWREADALTSVIVNVTVASVQFVRYAYNVVIPPRLLLSRIRRFLSSVIAAILLSSVPDVRLGRLMNSTKQEHAWQNF